MDRPAGRRGRTWTALLCCSAALLPCAPAALRHHDVARIGCSPTTPAKPLGSVRLSWPAANPTWPAAFGWPMPARPLLAASGTLLAVWLHAASSLSCPSLLPPAPSSDLAASRARPSAAMPPPESLPSTCALTPATPGSVADVFHSPRRQRTAQPGLVATRPAWRESCGCRNWRATCCSSQGAR